MSATESYLDINSYCWKVNYQF